MARHRRDDQQRRLAPNPILDATLFDEMLELAERLAGEQFLADDDAFPADFCLGDPEHRLAARRRGMAEHVEAGGDHRAHRHIA